MRDHKIVGVRLSAHETQQIEHLAKDKELTMSELVRLWLAQAARQAWYERQAQKGGE